MKPRVLEGLGLEYHLDDVVGTALLARAAAIQVRRTEGPTARMEDLAALSLGAMAVLDAEVTKRATVGLAFALGVARVPSPLGAVAVAISAATADYKFAPLPPPELLRSAPLDYAVFSLLWPVDYAGDILETISRDDGKPVGRLGISAYRDERLAERLSGPDEPIYGAAGERWRRWQDRISEGPYPLAW